LRNAPLYPRLGDFAGLTERLDPRGAFRNEWLETRVLGGGGGARATDSDLAAGAPDRAG